MSVGIILKNDRGNTTFNMDNAIPLYVASYDMPVANKSKENIYLSEVTITAPKNPIIFLEPGLDENFMATVLSVENLLNGTHKVKVGVTKKYYDSGRSAFWYPESAATLVHPVKIHVFSTHIPTTYTDGYGIKLMNTDSKVLFDSRYKHLQYKEITYGIANGIEEQYRTYLASPYQAYSVDQQTTGALLTSSYTRPALIYTNPVRTYFNLLWNLVLDPFGQATWNYINVSGLRFAYFETFGSYKYLYTANRYSSYYVLDGSDYTYFYDVNYNSIYPDILSSKYGIIDIADYI